MTAPATPPAVSLRALLEEMIERQASDLHVTAGERAKLRIDGAITSSHSEVTLSPKDTLQLAYSVLTENQKKRFEMEDELDFSFGIQNLARFRGNCFKQRGCVSMVIRQIPIMIKTFADLGLPPSIARMADKPRGLILVTGPTGSGKSTTLVASLYQVVTPEVNVLTVEDPVEYQTGGISQMKKIATLAETFFVPISPHDATGPITLIADDGMGNLLGPWTIQPEQLAALMDVQLVEQADNIYRYEVNLDLEPFRAYLTCSQVLAAAGDDRRADRRGADDRGRGRRSGVMSTSPGREGRAA